MFFFVVTPSNHVIPLPSITGTTLTKAASVRGEWRGRVDEVVRRSGNNSGNRLVDWRQSVGGSPLAAVSVLVDYSVITTR